MIDLVYKIGSKSEGENYCELRYSIRSAVEYFKDIGNIFIVGNKPHWLQNVIHIPAIDCYTSNKDANLINKLILACCNEHLSEKFLNMSDDFFFLQDIKASFFEVPYYDNKIINFAEGHKLTKWERRLCRTMAVLKNKNLPVNCYEIHMPTLIDKKLFPITLFKYDYGVDEGYCGNTLYYNTIDVVGKPIEDDVLQRFQIKFLKVEDIMINLVGKKCLNYTVSSFNVVLERFLANRFSKKSSFEV